MKSVVADRWLATEQGRVCDAPVAAQSRIELDPAALQHNVEGFLKLVAPAVVIPVIKSNAYGHGIRLISEFLEAHAGVSAMAVVSLKEALTLRAWGIKKRLLVLGFFQTCTDQELALVPELDIELPLYALADAKRLERISTPHPFRVHVKLDSGTRRIGLKEKELTTLIHIVQASRRLTLAGVFTHFAESESADQTFTNAQLTRFRRFVSRLRLQRDVLIHSACTAALLSQPGSRGNAVRLGLGLYGLWPSPASMTFAPPDFWLQPVLTWKTSILQVKSVTAGSSIGYDRTYIMRRSSRIAVLPVGYFDGLDRGLSNRGEVLIHGQPCPIRGRVCMNLTMVDVTDLKTHPQPGDEVVLLGRQEAAVISADEMAELAKTIAYEVVTRLNPLIPRNWR